MILTVIYPDPDVTGLAVYVAAGLNRAGHQATAVHDATMPGGIAVVGPYADREHQDQTPTLAEIAEADAVTATVTRLVAEYQLSVTPSVEFQP